MKFGGIGGGGLFGINGKYFFAEHFAGEASLVFRSYYFGISTMAEYHGAISKEPGLNVYGGAGFHLGFVSVFGYSATTFGLQFPVGLEYTLKEVPINFAVAWEPYLMVSPTTHFFADSFGVSVRYAFK